MKEFANTISIRFMGLSAEETIVHLMIYLIYVFVDEQYSYFYFRFSGDSRVM